MQPPPPNAGPAGRPVESTVAALTVPLRGLLAEAEELRSAVHAAEEARRRANRINLGVLAVVAMLVAALVVIGWQNNQLSHEVQQTNERVADCTTPGGACFEDGRSRTSGAIATLTRISVYVSQCGRLYPGESGPEYDRKLERCVADKLASAAQPAPSASTPPR